MDFLLNLIQEIKESMNQNKISKIEIKKSNTCSKKMKIVNIPYKLRTRNIPNWPMISILLHGRTNPFQVSQ